MARIFRHRPAGPPLSVPCAFLYLLQLLFGCVFRPHRRGCSNSRSRWEDSSGGAGGDQLPAVCSCHRPFFSSLEGNHNTARRTCRALSRWHPTMPWLYPEGEDPGDQIRAPWNRRTTMFNALLDYRRLLRSMDIHSSLVDWPREANDDIRLTTREGSSDNFDGLETTCDLQGSTGSRGRATANGHRTYTSTCEDDRYRSLGIEHPATSDDLVLQSQPFLNFVRHELDRDRPQRISINHGNLYSWRQLSWSCTTLGRHQDFVRQFSEHWSRRQWRGSSSDEISVEDVDSHDLRAEQSSIDSTDTVSKPQAAVHKNCVYSDTDTDSDDDADTDTDADIDALHGTVTTSTALVNFASPRSADSDTVASSSTQLGSSSSDDASSSTTEQPGSSDDMDDSDSSIDSSITTEELLVRQPDGNEEMEVSMAQEQASEAPNGSDGTRSTPELMTVGFKFLPTDREIVLTYLKPKVLNRRLPVRHPVEEGHNVYALDADEITLGVNNGDDGQLGFFFVQKQDAYNNGCYYRTPDGYWRIRGRPAGVTHRGRTVAFKTAMDFHRGRPPHGCRTPWSMFEYALDRGQVDLRNLEQPSMNAYVMCKVRRRESKTPARDDKRWRCPGLSLRRPLMKNVAPRRFRPERIVVPTMA